MNKPRFARGRVLLVALAALSLPCHASTRSDAVRNAFVKLQACPSTALNKLPCPDFVLDHKKALDCGGTDTVDNLQWLRIDADKYKNKWERSFPGCKHPTKMLAPV